MRAATRMPTRPAAGLIGVMLAASIAGCVAAPVDHAALDQARAAVEQARSAPRVRALAAAELDRAELTLERAQAAAAAGAPASHASHLAYAASRQAALAEALAAERVAQAEAEELQRALDQLVAVAPAEELRQEPTAADDAAGAAADAAPDLTLDLSELPFADAEPEGEASIRLDEVADRMRSEPERRLSIEADFDLPDPVARTVMERRIEAVRAAFLHRGIDPSRVRVHTGTPEKERTVTTFERLAP